MTDLDRNRRVAELLADTLAPLVPDLIGKPLPQPVRQVLVPADRELVCAAEKVVAAVNRLTQSKFTAEELPARRALERAAYSLRTVWVRRTSNKAKEKAVE